MSVPPDLRDLNVSERLALVDALLESLTVRADGILIVACFHARRDPAGLSDRA